MKSEDHLRKVLRKSGKNLRGLILLLQKKMNVF